MTDETKDVVRRALEQWRGDDFERATAAFRHCTPEEMQQPYGNSGKTRQEILDGYRKHVQRVSDARKELESA